MSLFECPKCDEESDVKLVILRDNIKQNKVNWDIFHRKFQEWLENGKVGNPPKEKEMFCNAQVTCLHCGYVHKFIHNHIVESRE